jgi:hypothetical protein
VLREIAAFTFRLLTNTALKTEARFLACTARSLYQLPYPRLVKAKKSFGNSGIRQRAREERRLSTVATSESRTLISFLVFVLLRGRSQLVADAWSDREVRSAIAGRRMPSLNARRSKTTNVILHCLLLRTRAWSASSREWIRVRL